MSNEQVCKACYPLVAGACDMCREHRLEAALREAAFAAISAVTSVSMAEAVLAGAPLPGNVRPGYWVPKALTALDGRPLLDWRPADPLAGECNAMNPKAPR